MICQLVRIVEATGEWHTLTCGHTTRGNGRPAHYAHQPARAGDLWWCGLCAG